MLQHKPAVGLEPAEHQQVALRAGLLTSGHAPVATDSPLAAKLASTGLACAQVGSGPCCCCCAAAAAAAAGSASAAAAATAAALLLVLLLLMPAAATAAAAAAAAAYGHCRCCQSMNN